jgi:hypothetical protein
LLDLSPDRLAEALLDAAVQQAHAARLRDTGAPLLARLGPEAQVFGEFLLEELARLAAAQDQLAQQHVQAALTRADRLRIDPLRHIPPERVSAARAAAPQPEAGPAVVEADDPAFAGHGWYAPERTATGSLRWSGPARCAALALPALGGGALTVALSLRAPYGFPLDLAEQDWFLDGVKLDFTTASNDGTTGLFEARITLPELPAGSRVTLLLAGAQHEDPAEGPRRDTRKLGLGLAWARIERA